MTPGRLGGDVHGRVVSEEMVMRGSRAAVLERGSVAERHCRLGGA